MSEPAWIRFLKEVAVLAVPRPLVPPRRILLGLPTGEMAAAILAYSAIMGLAVFRRDHPLDRLTDDHVGCRVSAYQSGAFVDLELDAVEADGLRIGTVKQQHFADVVRRLPEAFPEARRPRRVPRETEEAWVTAIGQEVEKARRVYARVAATPVVVIGNRSCIASDLGSLQAVWPGAAALVDLGVGLDSWFRHPAIVCGLQTEPRSWLPSVYPSLVICDGAAAWRSPLRRAFPDAPHILILDRRFAGSIELVETLLDGHTETAPTLWEPPAGVEAWGIVEHLATAPSNDTDEDLF